MRTIGFDQMHFRYIHKQWKTLSVFCVSQLIMILVLLL